VGCPPHRLLIFALDYLFTSLSYYLVWLAAVSLATFILYGLDKADAEFGDGKNRVPKILLHLWAVLGGFGGGWTSMFILWPKVRQTRFWVVLIVGTLLHLFVVSRFF
jgi:uncharacterized membrane protein YsdA (DUF1294 family)